MKIFLFFSVFGIVSIFSDMITLDNQTHYPDKKTNSIVKVQWAESSQEINEKNINSIYQVYEERDTKLLGSGKNQIQVPSGQKYFRILIWTEGKSESTYVTSWVPVVSDKTYILEEKDLYFSVLNAGSGC